jgi:hypothetical protein
LAASRQFSGGSVRDTQKENDTMRGPDEDDENDEFEEDIRMQM